MNSFFGTPAASWCLLESDVSSAPDKEAGRERRALSVQQRGGPAWSGSLEWSRQSAGDRRRLGLSRQTAKSSWSRSRDRTCCCRRAWWILVPAADRARRERMAIWKHDVQDQWIGPGNICRSFSLYVSCNCCR
ncbi:neuropeptide FF receptor 2 [Homo sapiens]|uniref:Isoform 4 of Neuropeptide FF receptor 2 n=1 Tax=Homo sapiens TaxID=9606 RepID=Q9Y5X5-4|nr:neuropeptide FF receptor 2 [Homo sapiens]KAI4025692.1 neuropeptide FF receptor 2 [Homo sapiens]CAC85427.1 Neuropeptide G-Protein-Coupled Receptor short form [Homo sapiens]